MQFLETHLAGAWIVELDTKEDDRGFFARAFCQREFDEHGIASDVRQANISLSSKAGTVRGMHFQYPPAAENKFIRCISGALLDVIVDLRPESPTFLQHASVELSAENRRAFVVPPRFAHGFMTLADDTEVLYLVSAFYTPAEEGGIRHDDPALAISWPRTASVISDKDASWSPLTEQRERIEQKMRIEGDPS
jgi:dTDP-4-dehydrorhamnose 3,5-epimerase